MPLTFIFALSQQQFNNSKFVLPRLRQRLEKIVGDGWLFEHDGLA